MNVIDYKPWPSVTFWWTPTCGYTHVDTDPLLMLVVCTKGDHSMTEEQFPNPPTEETEPALEEADAPATITITEPTIVVPEDDDTQEDPA